MRAQGRLCPELRGFPVRYCSNVPGATGNIYSVESQFNLFPMSFGPPGAALNFSNVEFYGLWPIFQAQ